MARELIKPKQIMLKDSDGVERNYILSRLPYPVGRKVAAVYPVSNMPKVGDYKQSEEVMREMFAFIHVDLGEGADSMPLSTLAMIENHVPDTTTGLKLEAAMLAYNFDFFGQGGLSRYLQEFLGTHLPSIIKTLTQLLPPSLVQEFAAGLKSSENATSKTS